MNLMHYRGTESVAIASVLALNPSVIILDEATSMLDLMRQNLLDLVRKLNQNIILQSFLLRMIYLRRWKQIMLSL